MDHKQEQNPSELSMDEQLDLLVDGPFVEAQKSIELKFRGSANQRVLDVPASLAARAAVWCEKYR
jgi:anaerobic ribonucleoside-triphosphate reductase activating protein